MLKKYTATEAAQEIGVSTQTLKRWEKTKEFTSIRDPWGRRIYTNNDIKKLKAIKSRHNKLLWSGSYFKQKRKNENEPLNKRGCL